MTHPITPPPELVHQWTAAANEEDENAWSYFATWAAQWGADQELEACCEWIDADSTCISASELRAARRPKPLSVKEQALALVDLIQGNKKPWDIKDLDVVRRALEALPE